jgi:hypothetical protein
MDKAYYAQAAMEVARGELDPALMVKALAEGKGDEKAAQALYLKLRAEEIRSEARAKAVGTAVAGTGRLIGGAANAANDAAQVGAQGCLTFLKVLLVVVLVGGTVALIFSAMIPSSPTTASQVEKPSSRPGGQEQWPDEESDSQISQRPITYGELVELALQKDPSLNRSRFHRAADQVNQMAGIYDTPEEYIDAVYRVYDALSIVESRRQ